jgi:hypothetical protein
MVIAILATFINDSIAVETGFIWRRGNILLTFSDVRFQNFSELSGLDGSMVNRGGGCSRIPGQTVLQCCARKTTVFCNQIGRRDARQKGRKKQSWKPRRRY